MLICQSSEENCMLGNCPYTVSPVSPYGVRVRDVNVFAVRRLPERVAGGTGHVHHLALLSAHGILGIPPPQLRRHSCKRKTVEIFTAVIHISIKLFVSAMKLRVVRGEGRKGSIERPVWQKASCSWTCSLVLRLVKLVIVESLSASQVTCERYAPKEGKSK